MANPKMYNTVLLLEDEPDEAGASVVTGAVVSAGAIVVSEVATVVSVAASV